MSGDVRVFQYRKSDEDANVEFETDTAFGDSPTIFFAVDEGDANYMHRGVLNRVYWRFNHAGGGTYRLSLWGADNGANQSEEQFSHLIWDSFEAWPEGCTPGTRYDAHELVRPFRLYDESGEKARLMWYAIDWSVSPVPLTGGFLVAEGRREAFATT